MFLTLLSLVPALFSWLKARQDGKVTTFVAELQNETERRRIASQERVAINADRRLIMIASLGHPVFWIPAFIIMLMVAFYVTALIIDLIFQLPGDVGEPSTQVAWIISVVIVSMFGAPAVADKVSGTAVKIVEAVKSRWGAKKD